MAVRVWTPATTANLGPGFDCLGMAVNLYNELEMELTNGSVEIEVEGEGEEDIPRDQDNLVWQAAATILKECGAGKFGLRIYQKNRIPMARGMGSSAAAIVGGMLGANSLMGDKLPYERIAQLAATLEGHPDNVLPCLYGGIIIIGRQSLPTGAGSILIHRKVSVPAISLIFVVPEFELQTNRARAVVPSVWPRADVVANLGGLSFLVLGFVTDDLDLISKGLQDQLHQRYREAIIPGLHEVLTAAIEHKALGAVLSGAGPSVVALVPAENFHGDNSEQVGKAMQQAFARHGIASRIIELLPSNVGAIVKKVEN